MFANPLWSVLLLAAPFAIYFLIIRPRLEKRFTDLYGHMDSFWDRVWARLVAFRTFWLATFTALLTALPDILVQLAPLDFSAVIPQPWAAYTSSGFAIAITLMKAFETKPGEQK